MKERVRNDESYTTHEGVVDDNTRSSMSNE